MTDSTFSANRRRDPLTPEARLLCDPDRAVVEIRSRWFITIGRPGFNSRANNGRGFATQAAAEQAIARFAEAGARERRARS